MGTAPLNVHAVKPRARTIRIGGEVKERPPVQKDGMTDARVVLRDLFRPSATRRNAPDVQFVGKEPSTK